MGQTLSKSGLFPPLLIEMIKVGERSGELERMLERVADNYEREVSHSLSQMTTVLEPMMTLAMAGVIVFMMLAVLMPIFQLNQLMKMNQGAGGNRDEVTSIQSGWIHPD